MLTGGDPDTDAPGHFYPLTLVADIDNDNPLVTEEQFGPALPIIRYTDVDESSHWPTARCRARRLGVEW